jgi:hypothetical protein
MSKEEQWSDSSVGGCAKSPMFPFFQDYETPGYLEQFGPFN